MHSRCFIVSKYNLYYKIIRNPISIDAVFRNNTACRKTITCIYSKCKRLMRKIIYNTIDKHIVYHYYIPTLDNSLNYTVKIRYRSFNKYPYMIKKVTNNGTHHTHYDIRGKKISDDEFIGDRIRYLLPRIKELIKIIDR